LVGFQETTQTPNEQTISYFIDLIKSGENPRTIAIEMYERGILGEKSISCPFSLTSNAVTLNFAGTKEILKCVQCPYCKKTVDAEIYHGKIHCPDCHKSAEYSKAA
jgi:ssDNA-binding Zn-finger/Zn-ribbon topoisomerase 1